MAAIWGSLIGGGLGLLGSMFGPDEQTTTSQNFPSPFLTGRPGTGPGGFDPRFGDTNLLGTVNQVLGRTTDSAFSGAGLEGGANQALYNRGQMGNPLERSGSSYIQNVLGGGGISGASNPFLNAQNRGVTGNTLGTAGGIIGGQGLDPNTNPYLQQTFNRAADLTRGRLASEFAGSGRDLGASQPARSDELQTLASNIFGGNYQQERNRQASLTGQSLGLGQQNLQNQRSVFGQGQGLGVQQQMGALSSALPFANQDFTNINAMLQGAGNPIDNLINRIGAIAPAAGGTATVSQPVHSNPFTAGLGGAALGSQLGGLFGGGTPKIDPTKNTLNMWSDRRLKDNIQFMGEDGKGYRWYKWNWNKQAKLLGADRQAGFGVIADEVMQVNPDAVSKGEDGFLRVNYGAL